jgi:pimeloyl-ACP methyl ester carboxylesterase
MTKVSAFKNPAAQERYFRAYDKAMAECPVPDEVLDVETHHGTTRVYRFGQGDAPPVVLLPALMASSTGYGPVISAFAARGPCYAVDTLGEAGHSVHKAPFKDIADRARCLDDVLKELGLTKVHLVGASTGGWHSVNQAIHFPGRVASISILDPTTVTAKFAGAVIWYGLAAAVFNQDRLWRRFMLWSAGADILDRADVQQLLTAIRTYRPKVPFQVCPADPDIQSIKVPVLALFGARSVVHDATVAYNRLRELLPHADVELMPDTGHYVFRKPEDVDYIVQRVLKFMDTVGH